LLQVTTRKLDGWYLSAFFASEKELRERRWDAVQAVYH
jgi:hypothetical protein